MQRPRDLCQEPVRQDGPVHWPGALSAPWERIVTWGKMSRDLQSDQAGLRQRADGYALAAAGSVL